MSLLKQFFTSPEPWNVTEYRRRAQKILPRPVFDFVDGGADDETALRRNMEAFKNVTFRPRVAKPINCWWPRGWTNSWAAGSCSRASI